MTKTIVDVVKAAIEGVGRGYNKGIIYLLLSTRYPFIYKRPFI